MRRKPKYSNGHILTGGVVLANGLLLATHGDAASRTIWVLVLSGAWMLVPAVAERVQRARRRRDQQAA